MKVVALELRSCDSISTLSDYVQRWGLNDHAYRFDESHQGQNHPVIYKESRQQASHVPMGCKQRRRLQALWPSQ